MTDLTLHTEPDFDQRHMTYVHECLRFANNLHLFGGTGAPADDIGNNGDYYLRSDSPKQDKQHIYYKADNSWIGLI